MNEELNVLIIEDDNNDVQLLTYYLKKHWVKVNYLKVDTIVDMMNAFKSKWDIILCDYHLPQFNGLTALSMIRDSGINTPFILLSGRVSEEIAAAMMQLGANDYVMKDNMKRLAPAISREIETSNSLLPNDIAKPYINTIPQKAKPQSDKLLHPIMHTHYNTSADSVKKELDQAVVNMLLVTEYIRKHQAVIFEKQNLTAQRFSILQILKRMAPKACTVNRIKSEIIYKTIDHTRLIEKMKLEGLILSEFNGDNNRERRITITDKGLQALAEVEKYTDELFLPKDFMSEEDAISINKALNNTLTRIKQAR